VIPPFFEDVFEREDVRRGNLKSFSQTEEGLVGWVTPSLLEIRDVRYVKLAFFGDLLLT
jgi:hypothetical protein